MPNFSKIFDRINALPPLPRALIYGLAGLLVFLLIWSASSPSIKTGLSHRHHTENSNGTPGTSTAISPLLFGTNVNLLNDHDQVLSSSQVRGLLKQIHTQIIRIPVRASIPEATEVQAARIIKETNAVPVIVLQGSMDHNVLADDTRIIKDINSIFGKSVVYYEYGNEEDAFGVTPERYTASWNAIIPSLKKLAPQGQFVGPVNYHYDQNYLTAFLQMARPRPEVVSWHEYACVASDTEATCLAHISDWRAHILNARAIMTTRIGTALPIMISEWNYAPNAAANDGKSQDQTFLTTWTQKALQELAVDHVFAAMQYSYNGNVPLVDGHNKLTAQGKAFRDQYESIITRPQPHPPVQSPSPSPVPVPPSPTPSPSPVFVPPSPSPVPPSPAPSVPPSPRPLPPSPVPPVPVPTVSPTPSPVLPTPTPSPVQISPTPSPVLPTPTPSPVQVPTVSPAPQISPTPSPVPVPTVSPTPSPVQISPTPSPVPVPTVSPIPSPVQISPTPVPVPPTPSPVPSAVLNAVDGQNPFTYMVGGRTCMQTRSFSRAQPVNFAGVTGTVYFQYSNTCQGAWALIVFDSPVSGGQGNARIIRNNDGKSYTCDMGGNLAVAPGQHSCYTGMLHDGTTETASAYGSFIFSDGRIASSPGLGPY